MFHTRTHVEVYDSIKTLLQLNDHNTTYTVFGCLLAKRDNNTHSHTHV